MWFHPFSSFSPQFFLCCCHLVYATWIYIYPRNLDLNLSTRFGLGFVHATLTQICPCDFELDLSTRFGLGCIHTTWTWICRCYLDLLLSMRLGLGFVHVIWSWIYPRDLDLDLSTRLGFVHAIWTWICSCDILAAPALFHSHSIQIISAWSIPFFVVLLLFVQLHLRVHPNIVQYPSSLCFCLHYACMFESALCLLVCLSGWPLPLWFYPCPFLSPIESIHWQKKIWEGLFKKNHLKRNNVRKCTSVHVALINE